MDGPGKEDLRMELSAAGLELLKRSEGFRSHTYLDGNGFATIGYGHRLLPSESFPGGVSEAQGAAMLVSDVRLAERAVGRLVKVSLTQSQFDALVDFCFNLGQGRLAASTLLKDLNEGRFDEAGDQLLRWDHAGAGVSAGLKARREAEFQLWTGAEPATQTAA
jgi:lysozyme